MSRSILLVILTTCLIPAMALAAVAAPTATSDGRNPIEATPERHAERFLIDSRDGLDAITAAGYDVTHDIERVPTGWEAEILVSDAEIVELTTMGAVLLAADDYFNWQDLEVPNRAAAEDFPRSTDDGALTQALVVDSVEVGRVDYFTTKGQGFLSIEAKSTFEGSAPALLVSWNAGTGTPAAGGGAQVMTAFTDSGEYMYHRVVTTVEVMPTEVSVVSALGGTDVAPVEEWLYDVDSLLDADGYQAGFIDSYKNPTELFDRIDTLAAQHPDIAEIVHLPHPTNGYQRKAQATIGSGSSAVVVNSTAWGHEGGNDITVAIRGGGPSPATATVDGNDITVDISATATAADVISALNTDAADLVSAHAYRTSGDGGTVTPTSSPVSLTDNLNAPDDIERGPFDTRAIRIGRHRDGSRPGVLIIAQDHAREWVPPLIALESVERLLANYQTDPASADIIDNVDIWVVPSNNPDGSHYSMFDYDLQRKNMTNHCDDTRADPGYRDQWGVDLNRGYSVGSIHDGYAGASLTCTASTFAGYEEIGEPEAKNIVALVEQNPNIKFFMTIHSNGGQLFWQPGTYIADGRLTPTRPPLGDETFYWQMAERILSHVKTYQDTVVRPDLVGGSSDVLYSSAGNVREELYINYGVYSFGWEVGGSTWNTATRQWQSGSFQPSWGQAQGEYMEYASGVTEMWRIAADYGRDRDAPTSTLDAVDGGFVFGLSEPAHTFYTTDGSLPTEASPRWTASGIREQGEVLDFPSGTTVRWLTVDPAGNRSTHTASID